MEKLPSASKFSFWKTGTAQPDSILDKAKAILKKVGGSETGRMLLYSNGRGGIVYAFEIKGERFRVNWPYLSGSESDLPAIKIQAATFIYHEIKMRVNKIGIFPNRVIFFDWLILPSGQTVSETDGATAAFSDGLKLLS